MQEAMKIPLAILCSCGLATAQTALVPQWLANDTAALADTHPGLKLEYYATPADALDKVAEAEAYIGNPNSSLLEAGTKLRWVHVFSAGIEGYAELPGIRDGRVALTNLKILQGPEIADHAFALLLHLTRNLGAYQDAQKTGSWGRGGTPVLPLIELRDRTLLVIGYGGIGTQVAERAKAFGMKVIAIDPKDIPLTTTLDRTGKPDELATLLPLADVVISCVPHTPESEGMIGAEQFAAMKDGTYFINVSRGKVVNTDALVQALQDKKIAAAGLDVVDPEPLPAEHPLWKMPNVIITPHVAGVSDARPRRQNELILDNLGRFARGLPLKNQVDPAKGY